MSSQVQRLRVAQDRDQEGRAGESIERFISLALLNLTSSFHLLQIYVPPLPEKAYLKQVPLLNQDDGIFEKDFIEDRRRGLEDFINILAGHPLVQGEKCLHMFLQEDRVDRDGYFPGKQRQ